MYILLMYKADANCKLSTLKGWKYLDDEPTTCLVT